MGESAIPATAGPGLPSMERLINLTEHEIALAAQDPPI
jgi:hypothetical protein